MKVTNVFATIIMVAWATIASAQPQQRVVKSENGQKAKTEKRDQKRPGHREDMGIAKILLFDSTQRVELQKIEKDYRELNKPAMKMMAEDRKALFAEANSNSANKAKIEELASNVAASHQTIITNEALKIMAIRAICNDVQKERFEEIQKHKRHARHQAKPAAREGKQGEMQQRKPQNNRKALLEE